MPQNSGPVTKAVADALIAAVRDVAQAEIMTRFRRLSPGDIQQKTGPEDLVTAADIAAERALTARIADILPQAAIVGEEAVAENPDILSHLTTSQTCVILDPVDGTANFARGLAVFGVILAVMHEGRCVFGLLYDPVLDDWVMATSGGGTWFARPDAAPQPLQMGAKRSFEDQSGFLALHLFARPHRPGLAALYPRFRQVTSLRCSCHEYRMLALGHADFMVTAMSKPWDHAAGMLIVTEAGGQGGNLTGACGVTDLSATLIAGNDLLGMRALVGPVLQPV